MNQSPPPPPDARRSIPAVSALLASPLVNDAIEKHGRERVVALVRVGCEQARNGSVAPSEIAAWVVEQLAERRHPAGPVPVINATGVVVHTNVGRAPLSRAAREAVDRAAGACAIEYDVITGGRGQRDVSLRRRLTELVPMAQDALVVNNCAAALVLTTAALAAGREVILSRGEMVEIGAGFRLRDIVEAGGATVVGVGATNRTHPSDYSEALGPRSAFVLKVHPSNFVVEGFHSSPTISDLANVPVPLVVDVGSGLLHPHPMLPAEPDVTSALRDGAHLVVCSGDKLLGGPQSGLIFGRAELVAQLRRHPLARALRVDKLTIAALEATLSDPTPTPVRAALETPVEVLRERCDAMGERLRSAGIDALVVEASATVGGGGAPGVKLPGWAVSLPEPFAAALRTGSPVVVGRVVDGRTLLDVRCVPPVDDAAVEAAVVAAGMSLIA